MTRNGLLFEIRWKIRFEKNEKELNVLTPVVTIYIVFRRDSYSVGSGNIV